MKRVIFVIFTCFFMMGTFSSCKKDSNNAGKEIDPNAIDTTKTYLSDSYESKLRDSIWYYYKILSLWENVIPPTADKDINKLDELGFIRKNYSQYFETGDKTLDYLMQLTKNKNPNRTPETNYDWYSFLDRGGYVSSEIQDGISSGLGMSVFYLQTDESGDNADLYVRMVEKNTSAYEAGLQRGDKIISMNGDTKIDYNYQKTISFRTVNNYLSTNNLSVKVRKATGQIVEKNLVYKSASTSPLLMDKILTVSGKKIGYFVMTSFGSITNRGFKTEFYNRLEELFTKFDNEGIQELVVDLRYNGGGSVETAEYLADRIAPSNVNGKLMYTYGVNRFLKEWGWLEDGEEFGPVKFSKKGNLNLSRVYFLVTSGTASASELLINSLKPVMNTYMIGTYAVDDNNKQIAENTYGKPVGFFGLDVVDDDVELYVSSFKMYNSKGEGDYFDGLVPNAHVWEFSNFYDFGDEKESMFASALSHIKSGSFTSTSRSVIGDNFKNVARQLKSSLEANNRKSNAGMYIFLDRKPRIK